MQQLMLKTKMAQATQAPFAFNVPDVDSLFPGFRRGDFSIVYGPKSLTSLISQLCVRAQLEESQGGLSSKVVFIDAASSSSLSSIMEAADFQQQKNGAVLENLISMRAYTAYRLTSLIMEKLEETVALSNAKIVVISGIAGPFQSDNVDDQEAKAVYSQIMSYLASLARKHKIIIVATYLPHEGSRRNNTLQEITNAKANVILRFTKTPYTSEVELEKHPSYMLGVSEFNPEISVEEAAPTLCYRIL